MKTNKPLELLAPGGSKDAVVAAVNCGCDSVYLGGKNFSARAGADNFDGDGLAEIIDYCHRRGVRVYVTINTLYKDGELAAFLDFAADAYSLGADAFIMQDFGCFKFLKERLPDIEYHASTQMTAHSVEDALFLEKAGFSRVVLARELSLDEIENIKRKTTIELETFAHGALCYSYSGACLMSAAYGGRSGNRGKCAQPCRLKYTLIDGESNAKASDTCYLLSPKDIMAASLLDKLDAAGVCGVKLEGRLKSPAYVAVVTSAYREAIDTCAAGTRPDIAGIKKRAAAIFNRGGFSEGYYSGSAGQDMMSCETPKHIGSPLGTVENYNPVSKTLRFRTAEALVPGDGIEVFTETEPHAGGGISKKAGIGELVSVVLPNGGVIKKGDAVHRSFDKALNDEAKRFWTKDSRKLDAQGSFMCVPGKPLEISLNCGGVNVTETGGVVGEAVNQPLSLERLLEQLRKTGGSSFEVEYSDYEFAENSFIGISEVNELRRRACESLGDELAASFERRLPVLALPEPESKQISHDKNLSVLVRTEKQLAAACVFGVSRIYCEPFAGFTDNLNHFIGICREKDIELYTALGRINRSGKAGEQIEILENSEIAGYLIRDYGLFELLGGTKKKLVCDYSMNVFNRLSYEALLEKADIVMPSVELDIDALAFCDNRAELLIYGKTAIMTTALCPVGLYAGGKKGLYCLMKSKRKRFYLKDRMNAMLPVITSCDECYARIYSDRPIYMLSKLSKLYETGAGAYRMDFIDEEPAEVSELVHTALEADEHAVLGKDFTYGHYFKASL